MESTSLAKGTGGGPADHARAVVMLCERKAATAEFVFLAQAMVRDGRFRPVLVVRSTDVLNEYDGTGMSGVAVDSVADVGTLARLRRGLRRLIDLAVRGAGAKPIAQFLQVWRNLGDGERVARRILTRHDPVAVIISDDRGLLHAPGFVKVARQQGRRSWTVPFGLSDPDSDAGRRRDRPEMKPGVAPYRLLKWLLARRFPNNIRDTAFGKLMFLSPPELLAVAARGMALPQPWTLGGGLTDRFAVFGATDCDRYLAAGVPVGKMFVAGQCSLDALWEAAQDRDRIRSRLRRKYDLDADRPLVICALPNLGEHGLADWTRHLADTERLVESLAAAAGSNLLLSLHPRQERETYVSVAQAHGAHILEEPLRDVLPGADLFVAYSSTIRWAVLLGIPTLALEYFDLGYELFGGLDGVVVARDRDEVAALVRRILEDPRYQAALSQRLAATGQLMVRFDGLARHRIIDDIASYCLGEPKDRIRHRSAAIGLSTMPMTQERRTCR